MIFSQLQLAAVGLLLLIVTHAAAYVLGHHDGAHSEREKAAQERAVALAKVAEAQGEARAAGERLAAVMTRRKQEIKAASAAKVTTVVSAASPASGCLSEPVVAALNNQPQAGATSELAAAQWIADAQAAHQACREQVINLTEWIATVTKVKPNE